MKMLAAIFALCLFAASSGRATVVPWNLDPNGTEGTADSTSQAFVSPGPLIAPNDYTAGWRSHTPLAVYYENHGLDQTALGIPGPAGHQRPENRYIPAQFEVGSIFSEGFTDGKLQIGNVQNSSNNPLPVWAPSIIDDSGVPTEGINDRSSGLVFATVANFTNDKFISIGAAAMPVAFQSTLTPVPEISALFPIVGLIAAVALTQILRRRRIAQLARPPRN